MQVDPSISYRCSACIWNTTQARIRETIYAWLIQVIQDRSYAAVALYFSLAWLECICTFILRKRVIDLK